MVSTYGVEPSVSYDVEVAFAANPWDTSPVYTSISDRVMYLRSFRGKTSPLSEFGPSTLEVWLRSNDRRFDPENAAGPFFGQLLPKKRVRVKVIRAGVTIGLLVAFTLAWDQDWERGSPGRVRLTAIDDTDSALNAALPASAYAQEVLDDSPRGYWGFQGGSYASSIPSGGVDLTAQSAFLPTASVSLVDGVRPIGASDALATGGTAANETVIALGSDAGLTAPVAIDAWIRPDDTVNNLLVFRAALTTTTWMAIGVGNGGGLLANYSNSADNLVLFSATGIGSVDANFGGASGLHHVVVYRSGTNLVVMVDGSITQTLALSAGTRTLAAAEAVPGYRLSVQRTTNTNPGAAISHVAVYTTAPSEARFNAHYQVGAFAYTGAHGVYGFELEGARINRMLDDIGHPTNLRNISPGGTRQAAYRPASRTALDGIREAERSGQGLFFFDVDGKATYRDRQWLWVNAMDKAVTFSDVVPTPAGKVGYRSGSPKSKDLDTVVNKVTVSYPSGAITNSDATSIAANRERADFVDCSSAISDPQDASNLGKYRVRTEKDPKSLIPRLEVRMRRGIAATFPKVAALELGDVVTIERTPPGGGAQTSRRHQVIGIEHEITRDQWFCYLSLGPAVPMADEVPYLQLGHATRGKIGAADGNKIPF